LSEKRPFLINSSRETDQKVNKFFVVVYLFMKIDEIRKTAIRLGERVKGLKHRFVFSKLQKRLFNEPRIKLIRGFRGSGKTTLLLQIFNKYRKNSLYVSADSPLIAEEKLYDLMKEFIMHGYTILLIDEVHKYPNWRRDVKAIYDEFPNVVIVCSGSAPLAFIPERREELIEVDPMGLKEFLELKHHMSIHVENEWKEEEKSIEVIAKYSPRIEKLFREYLRVGGYPIALTYDLESAKKALYSSIRKSIYEDSITILKASQEKVFAMNQILIFLATSGVGELSINTLTLLTGTSKSVIYEILDAMEKMKIIRIIRPYGRGSKLVRGSPKMLFYHPNLRYAICNELRVEPSVGAIREELAVFSFQAKGYPVSTIKGARKVPDYYVGHPLNAVVEVGGRSKTKKQLKGFKKSFVLKPDQLMVLSLF